MISPHTHTIFHTLNFHNGKTLLINRLAHILDPSGVLVFINYSMVQCIIINSCVIQQLYLEKAPSSE